MPTELGRSARLIILDPGGRLLLFRYHDEHKPAFWSTAGGELQEGEDYRAAAERELEEETGFKCVVGPLLDERQDVYAVARSKPACWVEHYFMVECDRADAPNRANWTDEERATIQDWKWWSLAEMRDQPDAFLPSCLGDLLESTLERRAKMNAPPLDPVVDYASPGTKPRRGAWWLVGELLAGAVVFALVSGVFLIGASFWWGGPSGQLGGLLYLAAIVVPMAVGVGGWILLAVLLAKAIREWRT